ncbi:sodium:calcium antiporter [Halalkalicoccus jeotgali]|uniref:Na+/Ca+ antiporter n=1 Tax=Halalkalicoccus jeotgali (strain DSM 18796 / CECT 7217 / JCM 14584 / KCTC 4019 / B3) TaxID=795797 RepID=D8J920_HALJB|nr:sodium:calcium antiporter [Halalkalicoccus jeotgali]ADJ16289.1 Na+/Ca+ antiporter, CaCA family protein [Halalkalicoccus jeotgali B3]ELY37023.1 Na+/Ca+ antiporter [Halalkalicoccus jeotgali B3]
MVSDLVVSIALLAGSVVGLWLGARLFVGSAVRLARRLGLSEVAIGLTVVAVGTSLPEVAVSVGAALTGTGDIAVGNVVGSNVFNLALILGFVALFGAIVVPRSLARRDGLVLFGASALAALVLVDLHLGRLEAAALVLALVAYLFALARAGEAPPTGGEDGEPFRARDPVLLISGLVLVLVSGDTLVGAAVDIARAAGVSEWAIGATVVAAGTSTPEFAVSVLALQRGRVGVSVGNLLGSNVFNALGVLGIAGLVHPLAVDPAALADLGWLLAVTGFVTVSLWSGHRLSRGEGGVLVGSELIRWVLDFLR